jgi:hypothetical protein
MAERMRSRTTTLGLLLLGLAGCGALDVVVPPADDSAIPVERRERYRDDAARIVVRSLPDGHGAELPAAAVASLYARLVLVDNAIGIRGRDSVVELYGIHASTPAVHDLLVGVEGSAPWVGAWLVGESHTGEPAVDGLVEQYGISVDRCYPFDQTVLCSLRTGRPVFVTAVAREFADVGRGIRYAEPDGAIGSSTEIRATREADAVVLEYALGWGDCPAGCLAGHSWRYRVYDDGRVEFVSSTGPKPPPAPES